MGTFNKVSNQTDQVINKAKSVVNNFTSLSKAKSAVSNTTTPFKKKVSDANKMSAMEFQRRQREKHIQSSAKVRGGVTVKKDKQLKSTSTTAQQVKQVKKDIAKKKLFENGSLSFRAYLDIIMG